MRPRLLLPLLLLAVAGCGDDGGAAAPVTTTVDATGAVDKGTLAVRLEATEGVFIEGFEIGFRITDAGGTVLDEFLWSDHVASLGDQSLEAYYDAVYELDVPAGAVTVGADVRIGAGPGPEPPDLGAERLPCELTVEVPTGARVVVEVGFGTAADGSCARIVDA